jgi:hypothetical protein
MLRFPLARFVMAAALAVAMLAVLPQANAQAGPLRFVGSKVARVVRGAGSRVARLPGARRIAARRDRRAAVAGNCN